MSKKFQFISLLLIVAVSVIFGMLVNITLSDMPKASPDSPLYSILPEASYAGAPNFADIAEKAQTAVVTVIKSQKGRNFHRDYFDIPFEDLNFPTFNGKIQIQSSDLELFDPKLDFLLHRNQKEFHLLSPAHKYFIHSQMGEIHKEFKDIFSRIFLNPVDIESIDLKLNDEVLVSNKFSEGNYILKGH